MEIKCGQHIKIRKNVNMDILVRSDEMLELEENNKILQQLEEKIRILGDSL